MPVSLASTSASSMHGAVVPIAYYTNSSDFQNIQFTNIPQNYQDLMIVMNHRGQASLTYTQDFIFLNSDGNQANYSNTQLLGNGSSASSTRVSRSGGAYGVATQAPAASATAGVYGSSIVHILNYANTSTLKTTIHRDALDLNGSGYTYLIATLYNSTAAITSLYFQSGSGNFKAGSTLALYGIRTVGQ
jgi:hypothetical protein